MPVNTSDQTPDRRFWTAYDYFKVEQEARAMRRAEIYALAGRIARRVKTVLANAGAQPVKPRKTATA
jgi:hypothetical protein